MKSNNPALFVSTHLPIPGETMICSVEVMVTKIVLTFNDWFWEEKEDKCMDRA